jgi:hypothetical protein
MARRPQYEIQVFGLRIQYWGPPTRRFRASIYQEKELQRSVKWFLLLALAPTIHEIAAKMLNLGSHVWHTLPLVQSARAVVFVLAVFLVASAIRTIESGDP